MELSSAILAKKFYQGVKNSEERNFDKEYKLSGVSLIMLSDLCIKKLIDDNHKYTVIPEDSQLLGACSLGACSEEFEKIMANVRVVLIRDQGMTPVEADKAIKKAMVESLSTMVPDKEDQATGWYKNLKEHSELYNKKARHLSDVRLDYSAALKSVKYGRLLENSIKHDFCDKDIAALAAIHKSKNMSRKKIEELLCHMGYRSVTEDFKNKDYDKYLNKDKEQDSSLENNEIELE